MQRDLACEELWAQSLARSRARRQAAAAAAGVRLPARSLSVAALVAVSGGTVAGVTVLQAGSAEQAVAAVVKSRGSDVRELQQKLGVGADGVFGLSRSARSSAGSAPTGSSPTASRARTRAPPWGSAPVRCSSASREARGAPRSVRAGTPPRRRRARVERRIGVPADGVFGPATESALKRWQASHGLVADGVAGPNTRAKMGLGAGPVLKRGGSRGGGGGSGSATVDAVIAAANQIASYPYKYGGGHGSFHDSGYDCSGSVSYALHGGGLLRSPLDSGDFMRYGAPGRGRYITIYANPGHVYMVVNGRRYDTSARFGRAARAGPTRCAPRTATSSGTRAASRARCQTRLAARLHPGAALAQLQRGQREQHRREDGRPSDAAVDERMWPCSTAIVVIATTSGSCVAEKSARAERSRRSISR